MQNFRFLRLATIACLAFLVALMVKLIYPQAALGRVAPFADVSVSTYSFAPEALITSAKSASGETLIAAATEQDALAKVQEQYVCITASPPFSAKKFASFNQSYIESQIVTKLAQDQKLKQCINQNRRKIEFYDLDKLYRVIYMTRRLQDTDKVIVIVGVGSTGQIPQRAQFSEDIVDFLAARTNVNQPSASLTDNRIDNGVFKALDENQQPQPVPFKVPKLGKILVKSRGNIFFPKELRFSGNQASVNAALSIAHDLDDGSRRFSTPPDIAQGTGGFPLFQLNFDANASDFDQQFLSGRKRELASAELTFSGLLLKGIPEYIKHDNRKSKLEADLKLSDIKIYGDENNKIAFIKKIGLPENKQLESLKNIQKDLNKKLNSFREVQERAKNRPDDTKLQAWLAASKIELANTLSDRAKILESIYKFEFQCAPTFERIVNFNIWGKNASTNNGNSSGNQPTSAGVGVGVRGRVLINIDNPTCAVSIVPPYSSTATTYADISITSSGRFGAEAQASARTSKDFNIVFKDKYGEYTPDQLMRLAPNERKFIDTASRRILKEMKEDANNIVDIQKKIENSFLNTVLRSPELKQEIIDKVSSNLQGFCNRYTKELWADAKQVCWATKIPTPEKAVEEAEKLSENLAKELSLRSKPLRPKKYIERAACDNITRLNPFGDDPVKATCDYLNKVSDWEGEIKKKYNSYKGRKKEIAEELVRKSIFVPSRLAPNFNDFSAKLAKKLLDLGLQAEGEFHDVNDQLPLQPADLLKLTLTVKSSADARLTSEARILETRPAFKLNSTLTFPGDNKQPTLKVIGVLDANYWDKSKPNMAGRIGGLRPLNLDLTATIEAKRGNKTIRTLSNKVLEKSEFVDEKSIDLNAQNGQRLINESVPLPFSN